MPDEAPRQESHHLVHARDYMVQPVAEFLVFEVRHQRATASGASVVINHQDIVGGPADIKLGVLRAASQGIYIGFVSDRFRVFRVVTMSGDMYHFAGLSG